MEKFLKPEMEVIEFDTEDIMAASADVFVPDMPSGDVDGCGAGACGLNDIDL